MDLSSIDFELLDKVDQFIFNLAILLFIFFSILLSTLMKKENSLTFVEMLLAAIGLHRITYSGRIMFIHIMTILCPLVLMVIAFLWPQITGTKE